MPVFGLEILQEPEEPGLVEDQKGTRERGPEKRLKSLKDPSVFFGGLRASGVRKRLEVFFCFHSLASVRQSALLWGPGRRDINNPEIISHHDIKTVLDWAGAQAVKTYNSNLPTPGMSEDGRSP